MKLVVVVGSGSNCGKTTLVCWILQRLPGLGAVKVSPRDEACRVEWGAGVPGRDTARYAACGAVKVARIVGPRNAVSSAWERIRPEFADCSGVVIEGGGSIATQDRKFTIFVRAAEDLGERPERTAALQSGADLLVITHSGDRNFAQQLSHIAGGMTAFHVSFPPLHYRIFEESKILSELAAFLAGGGDQ